MRRERTAWLLALLGVGFAAGAARAAESSVAEASRTELSGIVNDEKGRPLEGAIVSIFGRDLEQGARTAFTDDEGRFEVSGLPPGDYRLRAYLAGFLPSSYARVIVQEGVSRISSIFMSLASLESLSGSGDEGEPRSFAELRWLFQHGDRNVLKEEERLAPVTAADITLTAPESPEGFDPQFAVSGEFGVRAATYDQGLSEFPGAGAGLDAQLAYARLFIPANGDAHWLVSAQVLESALSSWAGRAEFVSSGVAGHRLTTGVKYGNYLYGDLRDFRPPEAALQYRQTGRRSTEWFGSAYAEDEFLLGPATVRAGLAYEYYDYLETPGYASPKLSIAYPVGSGERLVVRGLIDYRIQAPGGEDIGLLSRVAYADVYGPTRQPRSFLNAERTGRMQLGFEHHVADGARLGVRVFQERASNQLLRVYFQNGVAPGHFSLSNDGDYTTKGLGLTYVQSFGPIHGTVGYSYGKTEAVPGPLVAVPVDADDDIHDVTTSVATSIDRTRTRVQAAYRIIRHPSLDAGRAGFGSGSSVDSRFNVQVFQLLPFVGWNETRWELMVAVRNLFYEDLESASMLDEIAVIDAPRRVLGGVAVRF